MGTNEIIGLKLLEPVTLLELYFYNPSCLLNGEYSLD